MKYTVLLFIFLISCESGYKLNGITYEENPHEYFVKYYNFVNTTTFTKLEGKPAYKFFRKISKDIDSTDLEIDTIFTFLDHLRIKDGYKLDFVFYRQTPYLYAIENNRERLHTKEEFDSLGFKMLDFWDFIQTDDSPDSYLQLVLLYIMHNQFMRYGPAFYNDDTVILNREGFDYINKHNLFSFWPKMEHFDPPTLKDDPELYSKSKQIDPDVVLNYFEDHVEVSVLIFSNWGGYKRVKYSIDRNPPHKISKLDDKVLLEYNCNIMF